MRTLSKSKLLTFRQCPKRLWLEVHRPALSEVSSATQASFDVGHEIGDLAQRIYDPRAKGVVFDPMVDGVDSVIEQTNNLLGANHPIFEAGFSAAGARAFADVMLPVRRGGKRAWRMIEVKSSTSVKDYHRDDVATQAFIARSAGVSLISISVAHIDNTWVYPGGDDYQGLLTENDLTEEAFGREAEVKEWIGGAQKVLRKRQEPPIRTGAHCNEPYACGFIDHCASQETQAEYPVHWLPRVQTKALKSFLATGVDDMRAVPDDLLNDQQRRVKQHSISGKTFFDAIGAATDLATHKLPAYFLDFETIFFAIPIWKGRRPYQQVPFQFSLHRLGRQGKLEHQAFLDLTGDDPAKPFAEALIAACGERGPIFVYNQGFEKARVKELAAYLPRHRRQLLALNERIVDLLDVARTRYYHPSQEGSWSIKDVLPAIAPDLSYDDLDEVQNGGGAMRAYLEAIAPGTPHAKKMLIEKQLLDYCALDTYAMVRLWKHFSGSGISLS